MGITIERAFIVSSWNEPVMQAAHTLDWVEVKYGDEGPKIVSSDRLPPGPS